MSYTEITFFGKDGKPSYTEEIRNAWRGAISVWHFMEETYLPEYIPDFVKAVPSLHEEGRKYHRTPSGDSKTLKEVWDIVNLESIIRKHQIVMLSTYDNVLVKKENFKELIEAYRSTSGEFESSLGEQADIIEKALKNEDIIAVGWNQTSVCSNCWYYGDYDEEAEEGIPYDINSMDKHWFLFEEKLKE